ncbi:hypothetical protein CEV31_3615 [Brucella thiophenivorans]|uniref:Uncharacterized protein n=1 Tax=Brucella thiophenivorans TaxID=571255 RepID=A0A256FCS4_9HYPH|nr:hypothetical protein CEV31_3615 [Brucella thiophenivorans]
MCGIHKSENFLKFKCDVAKTAFERSFAPNYLEISSQQI